MRKIYLVEYHWAVGDTRIIMATCNKVKADRLAERRCRQTDTRNYTVTEMTDGEYHEGHD